MLTPDDKLYVTLNRIELDMFRILISKCMSTQKFKKDTKTIFILLHIYTNSRVVMSFQRSIPQ